MSFYTEIKLSNPIINPKEPTEVYELNWNLHDSKKYKPNGNGIALRYPLFRTNSNMYQYGYQPETDAEGKHTYDSAYLRFPDLAEYQPGNEYLGRTETSHGSYVFVLNEAQDHFTLHNFGSGEDKVKSDLTKNEPAETMTMVEDEYDENKLQWEGFPRNVYLDGQADWAKIARTVEGTLHTARIFECVESHIGADKLLGYKTTLIIRDGGEGYKVGDEIIITNRFIEQRIKVTAIEDNGAISDFEVIGVKESGADIEEISGHTFKSNRNIDNTLGNSTAFVDYGVSYPAGHEFDDNRFDEVIEGKGATFDYDCEPYYASNELAFYDNEEYNRWSYIKDIYVYLQGDIVLAVDKIGDYTEETVNKYIANETVVPLNEWAETSNSFTLVSEINGDDAPYDLIWVKANDLITDGKTLSKGSEYYLNNASDTSYQYLVSEDNPNEMEEIPMGATATAFSQVRLQLDGELWLKIPFGHFLTINVEEI